jgi:gamma-glutamyl:cysteine ligase YbdK (ATP-grasp superfamily)
VKRYDKVCERIGRLKEKYAQAAQHYHITVTHDKSSPIRIFDKNIYFSPHGLLC